MITIKTRSHYKNGLRVFFLIYQTLTILTDCRLRHPHGQLKLILLFIIKYIIIFKRCKDNTKIPTAQFIGVEIYKSGGNGYYPMYFIR